MKKVYFASLFLLIMFVSYGKAGLDIGIISIKFDEKTVLKLYDSPKGSKPAKTVEFFNDKAISSWNIKNITKHKEWLQPEILWLNYSSFVFRCKSQRDDWYEVIVNNENGETLWLEKSKATDFKSWETYLRGMFSIVRLSEYAQKIRIRPSESSEEIKYLRSDCFQVKSMQGEWVEIFTTYHCESDNKENSSKVKSGWIKCKQGNKLLVEYFITS